MLTIHTDRIGEMAVVECEGRIARSDAVYRLQSAVTSHEGAKIIVLDFSEVSAVEGDGLRMLLFLQRWARNSQAQLLVFNPSRSVRYSLQQESPMVEFEIPGLHEMMALLTHAEEQQKARTHDPRQGLAA